MKKAIVCTVIGKQAEALFEKTAPRIKQYAEKIGAELIVHTETKREYPYYAKMDAMKKALETHDRVIGLDIDLLIRKDCPDLFEIVPSFQLGMYDESKLASKEEIEVHHGIVKEHMEFWNINCDLHNSYVFFNTGVIVASQDHAELFTVPEGPELFGKYWDQGLISAKLTSLDWTVFDIGFKFNRMPYVDKTVNEHRLWSFIVHYAGIQDLKILDIDINIMSAYERHPEYFGKQVSVNDIKRL